MANVYRLLGRSAISTIAGVSLISSVGCAANEEYHFNGTIGDEKVRFFEYDFDSTHILQVTRPDGTLVEYIDNMGDDFKLDVLNFKKGNSITRYHRLKSNEEPDITRQPTFEEAQRQFDAYLKRILEVKTAQGLANISK